MRTRHYLIVRLSGIGDVVMASTVLRRLRAEQPQCRITWLTGATAAPFVERYVGLDAVIAIDERRLLRGGFADRAAVLSGLWRRLAGEGITDVILLHVDWRYRLLTAPLLNARMLRLMRNRERPSLVPGRYMGDDYAQLLGAPNATGPFVGHFPLAEIRACTERREGKPRVIIVPGGAKNVLRESALRRWPVASYRIVAQALLADGFDVMMVGDTADEWVRAAFDGLPVTDKIGRLSLPECLDVMRSSSLVISHDTGPMHLARLAAAPLIALFGPTMPSQFVLEDEQTVVLWGGAHLACRPCYDGRELARCANNVCMSSVTPALVLETARELLARTAA